MGMNLFGNFMCGSSISQSNGESTITQNGKTITVKGNNVSIINGKIFVDGKEYKDENTGNEIVIQNVIIEGDCKSIDCGGNVTVKGNVDGDIDCGGSVKIEGNHKGSIDCGGSVRIGQY